MINKLTDILMLIFVVLVYIAGVMVISASVSIGTQCVKYFEVKNENN